MTSAAEQASYGTAPQHVGEATGARRVGPLREALEHQMLRLGRQRLSPAEYRYFGLTDPDMTLREKLACSGAAASKGLNAAASVPAAEGARAVLEDKLVSGLLFDRIGLPAVQTQAVLSATRHMGDVPVLRDAAQLDSFLRNDALYPLFCKSAAGPSGAVRLECIDGHTLSLGNGETRHVSLFADEIVERHPEGYLVQTALDAHPQMVKIAGRAVGSVRIVTAATGEKPTLAYAVWRLPGAGAMSDNPARDGALVALLEVATGRILRARSARGADLRWVETHPVSEAPLTGVELPFWEEATRLAQDAHALFPDLGLCGTDIAIGPGGPNILGCTGAPLHALYQRASGKGIWNDELAPIWRAVVARCRQGTTQGKGKG